MNKQIKLFEKKLYEHCNIEFDQFGEEIVKTSLSAVLISFDEYLKDQWVSVEDKLPEKSLEFICHHDRQVFSAVYDDRHEKWFIPSVNRTASYYVEVSHWRPLPEPPPETDKMKSELTQGIIQ